MARARNIKPGFFRNADLAELSMEARLLFVGLWTLADREGRMDDRPKQIKMEIFPADSVDCDALLSDIAKTGMVVRYEVDGKRYLQVTNFAKHQNPHRDEKPSTIPDACRNHVPKKPVAAKHSANTVQAPCMPDADTVAIGLNPDPRILIPDSLIPDSPTNTHTGVDELPPNEPDGSARVSVAGSICMAMKAVGMASVNPSSPELRALIDGGADIGLFVEAGRAAVKKQKGFAYALATVKGQMRDAAALAETALALPQQAATETVYQRSMRERYEEATGTGPARQAHHSAGVTDITDIAPRVLEIAS